MPINSESPLARMERGLMAAHGAGDIHAATALAKEIRRMRAEEPQIPASPPPITGGGPGQPPGVRVDPDPNVPVLASQADVDNPLRQGVGVSTGLPRLDAALQGASAGFYDEAQAGLGALVDKGLSLLPGSPTLDLGERYRQYHGQLQGEREQFREEAPVQSLAYEVAGGLGTVGGAAGALAKPATGFVGRAGQLAGQGAGAGAIAGAGGAQPGERLHGGLLGAGIGAAGGLALGGIGHAGAGLLAGKGGRAEKFARRATIKSLEKAGISPAQAEVKVRKFGKPGALVDIGGKQTTDLAFKAASRGGKASDIAEEFLEGRVKHEYQRLSAKMTELVGGKKQYLQALDELVESRREMASPLYEKAFSEPVATTKEMSDLFRLPAMKKALAAGRKMTENDGLPADEISLRLFDNVKKSLDDKIGVSMRTGKKQAAAQLLKMKARLTKELDAQVPSYGEARQVFAGSKSIENALEDGAKFLRGETDIQARAFSKMTISEREAYKIGAFRALKNWLGSSRDPASLAKRMETPKMRERLDIIFPDTAARKEFARTLANEARFADVRNLVIRGSQTAERQAKGATGIDAGVIASAGVDAATGGVGTTFLRGIANYARTFGLSERKAEELAKLLMTPGARLQPPAPTGASALGQQLLKGAGAAGGLTASNLLPLGQ